MRILRYLFKRVLSLALAFALFSSAASAATVTPVPLGGTGASSFTSNRILKGNGTSAIQASGVTIDSSNNISGAGNLVMDSSVYTVGPTGSGAKYITDGTADEVQINQAMNECAAASPACRTVKLTCTTFTIADLVLVVSNINLIGCGIDKTIIKAVDGYVHATGAYHDDGSFFGSTYHVIVANKTPTISNVLIEGITFDANGQNAPPGRPDDGTNQALHFVQCTDFTFRNNKVTNSINWTLTFYTCTRVRVEKNIILNGWSSTYTQGDGIHLRDSKYFWVTDNYIDTNGASSNGDDAITICTDQQVGGGQDTEYGTISHNKILSNSRGILLCNSSDADSTFEMRNILVSDNEILGSRASGIAIQKIGSGALGHFYDITINNNKIYDHGQSDAPVGDGSCIQAWQGSAYVAFRNLQITNNTCRHSVNASYGHGIYVLAKVVGLTINSNTVTDFAGLYGIRAGTTSHPVTDYTIVGNRVDSTAGGTNVRSIDIIGGSRGVIAANQIYGANTPGTTVGILLEAAATAGNDPDGVPNAETTQYNNIYGNEIHGVDDAIREGNIGANPDNNNFSNNTFDNTGTRYTILGSSTSVRDFNGTNFIINKTVAPLVNGMAALGTSSLGFSDGFFASGAVLNFNAGDVTVTHAANNLLFAGASSGYTFDAKIYPTSDDGAALGDTTHNFSDLFLASGAVVNFANGNATITHASNTLTVAGSTNTYKFNLASGFPLEISSSTANTIFRVISTVASSSTSGAGFTVISNDGAALASGDRLGSIFFSAAKDGSSTIANAAAITGFASEGWGASATGAELRLEVTPNGSTTRAAKVKLGNDGNFSPAASDGSALGTSSLMWSDLFLADGAVLNFNNGNVTMTHSSGILSFNEDTRLRLSTDNTTATGNALIDLDFNGDEAKAVIAYRDKNDAPKIWLAGHDYLSYPSNRHQHFSIETTNVAGTLLSRFEIPFDSDVVNIETHDSNFIVGGTGTFTVSGGASTFGGNITVTGTTVTIDSTGTATHRIDRGNTSSFASFAYATAGTDQWAIQLRNDSTNKLYEGSTYFLEGAGSRITA
jgi:hypothetical protein